MRNVYVSCLLLLGSTTVLAQTVHRVTSLSQLQTAINNAVPGDHVVLANGSYTASGPITVGKAGTSALRIAISPDTTGGAHITGGSFTFRSPAAFVTLQGFVFNHAGGFVLSPGTNHIRITRNVFDDGQGHTLDITSSNDNEVDHNSFTNKNSQGQWIRLSNIGGTCAGGNALRNRFHHNFFFNFVDQLSNGNDLIEAGGDSTASGFTIFENNLVNEFHGENELVSNKSADNIYRFNTFENSNQVTMRDGNRCVVQGNFFINTQGLRFFGDDHRVFNNYFTGNTPAIVVGTGSSPNHVCGQPFGGDDRPDRVQIVFNTLVNNNVNIEAQHARPLGATNLVVANNIIVGGGAAITTGGAPFTAPTFEGNIIFNATPGILPSGSFRNIDPRLAADSHGILHLTAGSPAIKSSVGSFAFVTDDLDGQPRSGVKDVGADEFSTAPVIRRPLTPADVGPNAP